MSLVVVRTRRALRAAVGDWKGQGLSVGLVPTMGALHDGHVSLVRAALQSTERVVVTLFVNPAQFNNPADLAAYPRTEEDDAARLSAAGAHLLYAPGVEEIYPEGFATTVRVTRVADDLEGAFRPGHFAGVATVCAKLFLQSGADRAFFGEKDFQQVLVVRRMAADLDIPITIVDCPTVRDVDGLAQSSRNVRLSPAERAVAPALFRALSKAAEAIAAGGPAAAALAEAEGAVLAAGFAGVDYLALRSAADLRPLERASEPARLLAAAWLGGVRLIDNVAVPAERRP